MGGEERHLPEVGGARRSAARSYSRGVTDSYDMPLHPAEQEPDDVPADGISYDPRELPAATGPAFDYSIFDDLPLDDEGVPVLPADFDRSRLPKFDRS